VCPSQDVVFPLAFCVIRLMAFIPTGDLSDFGLRKQVKLLVVDDHSEHFAQVQEVAAMYHADFAFECRLASNSKEALEVTAEWHPSVVLVDLHLIASALDTLKQIAEQGPVVVATSETQIPELPQKVSQYGASGYLVKSEALEDVEALLSYVAAIAPDVPTAH
jgi:DNA-binding NarL/FixJ family response regulator